MDTDNDDRDRSEAYSRLEYRRFVAWSKRIEREAPLLLETLAGAPVRRILDLGCGTGEHSRFLAANRFEVVGIDLSRTMLEEASLEDTSGIRYVRGDLRDVGKLVTGEAGGAICLGNTLVHLLDDDDLKGFLTGLACVMTPGGRFLFQILNYARLRSQGVRHLPLNFLRDGEEERVFLRIMEFLPQGRVRFMPTTLRIRPELEAPLEVVHSRQVLLRCWSLTELEAALQEADFSLFRVLGDMEGSPYVVEESNDLVVVAERAG